MGLDQDMMQRTLSCKNFRDARKNMIIGGVLQIFINLLFLTLGVLLYIYVAKMNIDLQAEGIIKADDVFPFLAMQFSPVVGVLFIIGLISAAYGAAGSALTALTTSFTVDILESPKTKTENQVASVRKKVHIGMAIIMAASIFIINILNNESVIQTVYKIASYTYGPLLGMFVFGIFTKWKIRDKWAPLVAIVSPVICLILDMNSKVWFKGYEFSHERLIFNALFTFAGLCLLIRKRENI
jgi:Na+/proline symporter